jgi:hypothetical protein
MGALVLTETHVKLDGDDTLDTIAGKIKACLKRSEDYRVTAGQLLAEARHRVDAGEAGAGMGWEAWCKANVERSYRDVQRLLAIATAPDPAAAATTARETTRAQVAKSRADDIRMSPPVRLSALYDRAAVNGFSPRVVAVERALNKCTRAELAYLFADVIDIFRANTMRRRCPGEAGYCTADDLPARAPRGPAD